MNILLPLFGTTLGAFSVYMLQAKPHQNIQKSLDGLAAGIMMAASFFSLLLPAIQQSDRIHLPILGLWLGMLFLLIFDHILHKSSHVFMILAVVLNNIPEGMAVGLSPSLSLSIGIALQNIPEGAIVAIWLRNHGWSTHKAWSGGFLSGIVEPIAGICVSSLFSNQSASFPTLLGFACGAMLYVIVVELIPDMSKGQHSSLATTAFTLGFSLMMVLDVLFGA